MQIIRLIAFAMLGLLAALIFNLQGVENTSPYAILTGTLLAIGLYGSTYGIEHTLAKKHWKLIASAVSIGVMVKATLIAGVMILVFGNPAYALLGVVMAQIDPLSTAAIMRNSHMSARAKTILSAWASFDDPVTVIIVIYLAPIIGQQLSAGSTSQLMSNYGIMFAANLAFASGVFLLWKIARRYGKPAYVVLPAAIAVAVANTWALGIALIGLFLRPPIDKTIDWAVKIALGLAAILLGMLLVGGVNLGAGATLGVAAFTFQIVVAWTITSHLPRNDRLHLAFAQQNGITAIILALLLESVFKGTIAIVAPAILVVNLLHTGANKLLAKTELDGQKTATK
jgi:hypothetical protein